MPERTLNKQLSGDEIIEAHLDTMRQRMKQSGYFRSNDAFDWFSSEVTIKCDMHDTGAMVKADLTIKAAAGTPNEGDEAETVEMAFNIDPAPPNEVRVQTGQPVPVLTTDATGKQVEKSVRYSRKDAKKAGAAALLLFLCLGMAHAQAPVAPAKAASVEKVEYLTGTEQIALKALHDEQELTRSKIATFESDVRKTHPGWHFDEPTGTLQKDKVEAKADKK